MTRHRSPRGRGAPTDERHRPTPTEPATGPLTTGPLAGGRARARRPGRSALRHGAFAAGITGGALALVAPPALHLADTDTTADPRGALELSSESTALAEGPARSAGPAVSPVASAAPVGASSADLLKASDRARQQAEAARAEAARAEAEREAAARAAAEAERAEAEEKDEAERAAAAEKARTASTSCGISDDYGGVASPVQEVGNAMQCVFPGHEVLGVGERGGASDHPDGYALDFMTDNGDAIADCVVQNRETLGVSYVIWDQRINTGSGWEGMEDRGGATANHEDHVHISFERGASPDPSALTSCG